VGDELAEQVAGIGVLAEPARRELYLHVAVQPDPVSREQAASAVGLPLDKPQDALDYESRIDRVLGALERCRVPTVAAIRGACTGGGAGIAVCCDLRIASTTLRTGFPVARTLGNCLSSGNYARLAALIGPARVKDMIFRARLLEAPEALAIGLVTEVVDDAKVMERAEEVTKLVASQAPLTLLATKESLLRLRPSLAKGEGDDLILMCYMSQDFREGMQAFLEKRAPQWKGQ
jgi:enoyl-CoA hydratase/carnithine racemase